MSVTKFIKVRLPEIGDIYTKYNAIEFGTTVYWFRKIQKRSVVLKKLNFRKRLGIRCSYVSLEEKETKG